MLLVSASSLFSLGNFLQWQCVQVYSYFLIHKFQSVWFYVEVIHSNALEFSTCRLIWIDFYSFIYIYPIWISTIFQRCFLYFHCVFLASFSNIRCSRCVDLYLGLPLDSLEQYICLHAYYYSFLGIAWNQRWWYL